MEELKITRERAIKRMEWILKHEIYCSDKLSHAAINMAITALRSAAPENKALTCEGCAYKGKYEAEYEYGYPSPCTACKRRAADNYVRRPEGAPSEGSEKS